MDNLHIIDGHGWFHRAYWGSIKTATGEPPAPDHALTAFRAMLKTYTEKYQPSHLVVAMDVGRESFRQSIFPGYKSNRKPVPPDLTVQLNQFSAFLDRLGVAHLGAKGFEADDIGGTLCKMFADTYQIYLSTGAKDW